MIGKKAKYNGCTGTIRYIGEIQGAQGEWVGLELDTPGTSCLRIDRVLTFYVVVGRNNGTLQGITYFGPVQQNHGLFVRRQRIET